MQRFQVHSHSQALTPTHRSLQPVASIGVQPFTSDSPDLFLVNHLTFQLDYDIVRSESVNNDMNVLNELPDINQLKAEFNVLGRSDSPPPDFVMPTNYTPATPRYSPVASPAYSPSISPLTINTDSESEHGNTPPQNDGPIITRGSEKFNLPNDDSDIELDREVELINMMGAYINRNRFPIQINGVYIFSQDNNNIHDLKWEEYPNEPCSDHCVIPINTDKSFARFYLTHSLCLKHRSTLTMLGPWIYITSKVSTITKLYKCPQITHFIVAIFLKSGITYKS